MVQQQHQSIQTTKCKKHLGEEPEIQQQCPFMLSTATTHLDWSESNREDITVELHILLLKHFKDRKIKTILKTKSIFIS